MHKINEEKQEEGLSLIDRWISFKYLFRAEYIKQFIISLRSQNLFPEWTAKEIYLLVRSYEKERERAANYWGGSILG